NPSFGSVACHVSPSVQIQALFLIMISRTGVFGVMPGSIAKSKSSPERSPCSLMGFLAVTVPFTDHTPVSMFFIAAFTSGSRFSWPDTADFLCGLAKVTGAFTNKRNAATAQIQLVIAGMIFFIFPFLIRSAADGDDGAILPGPIHRSAVTDRGGVSSCITRFRLSPATAVSVYLIVLLTRNHFDACRPRP